MGRGERVARERPPRFFQRKRLNRLYDSHAKTQVPIRKAETNVSVVQPPFPPLASGKTPRQVLPVRAKSKRKA